MSDLPVLKQSARALAVEYRTYRRPLDESATAFETRPQMVKRAFGAQHRQLAASSGQRISEDEVTRLEELATAGLVSVAGRTLWLGGTPYAADRACCQFNCAFSPASTVYDCVDIAWLLLNGCGVGFKPQVGTLHGYLKPVQNLEVIDSIRPGSYHGREENQEDMPTEANGYIWTIRIGDSAVSWARGLGKALRPPQTRIDKVVYDGSEVRGAGQRLKGYGWICNGWPPLARCLTAIHGIMNSSAGGLLDEIRILDVVNWFGTILSSRRSAQIAILDAHNPRASEFGLAKKDYFLCNDCGGYTRSDGTCTTCGGNNSNNHRRQSNNTLLFWSKPLKAKIEETLRQADECGGDPGICNAEAALKRAPWFQGANPCVPGHTRILTDKGYVRIDSVVDQKVTIWNGTRWSEVEVAITGHHQKLLKVNLSDGTELTCTPTHEWLIADGNYSNIKEVRKKAMDLEPGDRLTKYTMPVTLSGVSYPAAYSHGFYCGDGFDYADRQRAWLYGPKIDLTARLDGVRGNIINDRASFEFTVEMPPKFQVPLNGDLESRLKWLAGLLDADGTVLQNPNSVCLQLGSIHLDFLRDIRLMLTTMGVQAKITVAIEAGDRPLPDGRGGSALYPCQKGYRLLINAVDTARLVNLGLQTYRLTIPALKPQRDARRFVTVVSVEDAGVAPLVYCFYEKEDNRGTFEGIVTGQCMEILLARSGFCNLVTNCLPRFKRNFSLLEDAVYHIARANYRQTCVNLQDGVLQPSWHQTNESLRLCGVSMTGIVQAPWLTDYQIRRLRNAAVAGAYSQADEWKLPRPKAICTIKPEGTGSKCWGSTDLGEVCEGIHKPLGKYIFNWINFSVHDPLVSLLEAAGYRTLPNPADPANVLICFPLNYRGVDFDQVNGVDVNLESAISQLERYLRWQNLWCDYNVSCTISYSSNEIPQIVDWLDTNWDRGFVAVSFLRRTDPTKTAKDLGHPYLPQEVVTMDSYHAYASTLRPVDWSKVSGWYELDEMSCATGVCPMR